MEVPVDPPTGAADMAVSEVVLSDLDQVVPVVEAVALAALTKIALTVAVLRNFHKTLYFHP